MNIFKEQLFIFDDRVRNITISFQDTRTAVWRSRMVQSSSILLN